MPRKFPRLGGQPLLVFLHALLPLWLFVSAGGVLPAHRWSLHLCVALLFVASLWWCRRNRPTTRARSLAWLWKLLPAVLLLNGALLLQHSSHLQASLSALLTLLDVWLFTCSLHWLLSVDSLPRFWRYYLPLLGVVSSLQAIAAFSATGAIPTGASGMLVNTNHLAAWLTALFGFTLATHSPFKQQRPSLQYRNWLLLGLLLVAIVLTQSRTGMAIGITLLLAALYIQRPMLRRGWLLSASLAVSSLLAAAIIWQWWLGKPLLASLLVRQDLWRTGWHGFLQHPWVGNGFGSFHNLYLQLTSADTSRFISDYAHNDYLQLLVETGLLGMAILILGIWRYYVSIRLQRPLSVVAWGAVMGASALLLYAFIDFPLQLPSHLLLLTLLLNVALHCRSTSPAATTSIRAAGWQAYMAALAALLCLSPGLLWSTYLLYKPSNDPLSTPLRQQQIANLEQAVLPNDALQAASALQSLHSNSDVSQRLAALYEQLGNHQAAQQWHETAVRQDPGNLRLHEELGNFHLRSGNHLVAWRAFQIVVKAEPQRFGYFFTALSEKIQDPLLLKSLVPATPAAGQDWLNFIEKRLPQLLLSECQEWLQRFPDCAAGFAQRELQALIQTQAWPAAMQAAIKLEKRCTALTTVAWHFQALATWRAGSGDASTALQIWRQALDKEPESSQLWHGIDNLLAKEPQLLPIWLTELRNLTQSHLHSRQLQYRLCLQYDQQGLWQEALACAKQLTSYSIAGSSYKMLLARLYMQQKMYSQGMRLYRELITAEPSNAEAYLRLAQAYQALRLHKEALQLLESALRRLPDDQRLRNLHSEISTSRIQP